MAEWEVTRPDGSTYIVTTSDDATEQDVQNYVADHFRTAAAPTPEDDKDFAGNWFGRTVAAPAVRGWNSLQNLGATAAYEGGIFSKEDWAESIAENTRDMRKVYMGENVVEGMKAITEAEGWIDPAIAIVQNPGAVVDTVIQSLVASIPSIAGMFIGRVVGAPLGAMIAGPPGAVGGAIAGQAIGAGTGSFAVEYSNALVAAMMDEGIDTANAEAVLAFLNDPVKLAKAKEFARTRGYSVGVFDALSAGIAGRLFAPISKGLSGAEKVAAATKVGREAAEATKTAMLRSAIVPEKKILQAAARESAKAVTRALPVGSRLTAGATELASQMVFGATGEAVAQVATKGEIDKPGEVWLEGIAEGPIGILETAIGIRGPRIAPDPLAPGEFLTPPTPLSRDQYDQPIEGDPIVFAEEQAVNFAYDTPVSMAGGVPSTDQDDYNVVPFDGTNEQGDGFSGWRVETSTGIPVTPVIANEETAYAARESFANTLDNVIAEQEQLELNDRVNRAMGGEEQAERAPDLAGLAAGADAGTTVAYNDLSAAHKKKIDGWRINNRSIAPFLPEGRVAVEELSGAGIRESSIDKYLPDAPETPVTPATIKQIATAKNIETSDDAFQKFAARVAGTSKTQAGSWETMGESQLAAIKKRLDGFDRIPADENQKHSIPVTEHRPFSGAQYRSVVAHARRQAARDTTYRVERNGKAVDGGTGFNTEREARRFAESLPSRKGLKIKGVKMKAPLREGEILKSEVKRVLGVKKATNTDAILDAAVERGDLIKVRGAPRGRYRVAEYEIREAQPLMPGLQDRLEARLRGLGINTKRVSLELVEGLEGPKGVYVNKVIRLALDKLPENATQEEALEILGETMDHETVHALFELGVLTVPEKESLYRFARGARVPRAKGEKGRRLTYFDVAFARYSGLPEYQKTDTEGNLVLDDDGNPEPNFESIMEEGVAEAFRDYAAGRLKPQAQVRTIFSRIVNFFRRMTTLSPADAQYFLMTFSPAREGQYRDSGRGRRPTGMQRDVDVPEGSPGMGRPSRPLARYAIDDPDRQANVKHIWVMEDGKWVPHAALEDDSTSTVMSEAQAELSELREQGIKARFGERFPARYSLDDGDIKGSAVGEEEDRAWRRIKHPRTKGNKILGAPSWIKNPADFTTLRKRLRKLIREGVEGRYWYEDSAQEALRITGGDLPMAEKFIGLLAIYSPQNKVFINTAMAIKAFTQWSNGQEISVKTGIQDRKAQAWMDHGTDWGGRKVNSFYTNLMYEIVSNASPEQIESLAIPLDVLDDINKATVDLWVLRAFGYDVDSAGWADKGSGKYSFAENELRYLAGILNRGLKEGDRRWLPHQVQAALWSAIKGRSELPSVKAKTNAQSLKRGYSEIGEDGKPKNPSSPGPKRVGHMKLWLRNALAANDEEAALSIATAKGAFSDMIGRIAQAVTWEAVPSSDLQSPLLEASDSTVADFTEEALELILDDSGVDVLAVKVGVPLGYTDRSTRGYERRIAQNVLTGLVPIKPANLFDNSTALAYARAIQYIFKQKAVPIFRADPSVKFAGDYKVRGAEPRNFDTYQEALIEMARQQSREADLATKVNQAIENARATGAPIPKYAKNYKPTSFSVEGGKFSRGVGFRFGRPLNKRQERSFFAALRRVMGQDVSYTKITPTYFSVVNYRGENGIPRLMEDDRFIENASILEREDGERLGIDATEQFGVESEYGPIHDWVADPEGTVILGETSITRQPDFQNWARDRREAFDSLVGRYEAAERGDPRELSIEDTEIAEEEGPPQGARYSLEEDRMLDRIERKRERARQRKAAEEERGFQNVFNGFTNIQPDAFAPIKIYNGGVTPLVVDGKQYPVVMTLGHNQWNDEKQKNVGWGERHAIDHLPDILENTSYKSVDEFVSGVLNMYHANRVEGTLKEANISVFESNDYSDNIRGPKIVIRWKNLADPNWPYPATLVLQVMDFSGMEVKIPELKGKSFASVTTGYALPALDEALEPRPMAALNPDASPMAKGAAGEAKPNEKIDRKLSKKYSLDGRENLPDDYKDPYEKAFGSAPRGPQRSLGEAILNMFSYQDIMTKPSRLRHMIVDVWEPVSAAERTLRKTMPDLYNDIYADSSASAMLSMLGRAAGLTQQYMTVGGIMYTRGMFVAINDRIAANAPPELRDIKQRELADFKARNRYAPDDEVKGLMQIFEPLVELQRVGGYEAWQLYGAARRAQRLLAEGRERLLSDEDIKKGLSIAEDTRFFKDGESVIVKVYEDYQKLNNSLISMMQDANLISPEAATLWRDNGDYMPFYRELYVDDTREGGLDGNVTYQNQENNDQDKIRQAADDPNNRVFDNLYNVKAPPQLKGGRVTYFVMVGNTRASSRVFDTIKKAYAERDKIRELNKGNEKIDPKSIDVRAGTQRIRGEKDPLENILRNASAAITGSMRNVGLLRALRDQVRLGMASKMDSGAVRRSEGSPVWNQLGVRVKGKTVWYETTDRLLLNSVQATGDLQQHPIFMSLMTVPANVLRELITKSPDFMLANLIRDTVTAWVTSGTNITPVVGTINGFARALGGSHLAANVAASGITGGFDFKSDPLDISKSMRKYMKRGVRGAGSAKDYLTKGFLPTLRSPLNPVLKLWQFADDITTASDMATRIAVYNKVLRETGSEAQASLEALEVINFSRKGANSTIQYLTAVVPFLNARLQGLDVLWRGASDRGITGHDVQQRKKRYIFRMLTLVALSTAYAMAHSDDPEEDPYYANATAEKKDMYWIIRPEWLGLSPFSIAVPKIPIAFEVGLITKTIPERIVRLLRGQDDLNDTMASFGRAFVGTLNFNPVPQFIKPLAEAALNLNTYTWRPIVPYYSEKDAPELASAGIGQTSKEIAKVTGVSAEKVQHILRGYTGTLGMYALQAADAISRSLAGTAEAPDFNVHQYPFFQRFMQSKWGGGDKQEFYALRGRLEELTSNISGFEKMGDFEEARKRKRKHPVLYENKARINHIEKILNNLRHERESIIRDRYTPSDQKKKMINTILRLESEALSGIKKLSIESRR